MGFEGKKWQKKPKRRKIEKSGCNFSQEMQCVNYVVVSKKLQRMNAYRLRRSVDGCRVREEIGDDWETRDKKLYMRWVV